MNLPKYLKLTKKHNRFYLLKLTSTNKIEIKTIRIQTSSYIVCFDQLQQ